MAHQEPLIAESTFPLSRTTRLSRFVARSEGARVSVARLASRPTGQQQRAIVEAARKRTGIFYDTGFNLRSRRQFCSRYVREVIFEATGTSLGEVETFATLLARQPDTDLGFWRLWCFGRIPWQRENGHAGQRAGESGAAPGVRWRRGHPPLLGSRAC
jgi:hypothetical protein